MTDAMASAMLVAFGVVVLTMIGNTLIEWYRAHLANKHAAESLRRALVEELRIAKESAEENSKRSGDPIEGGSMIVPVSEHPPIYTANIGNLGVLRPAEVAAVVRAYAYLHGITETLAVIGTFETVGPVPTDRNHSR